MPRALGLIVVTATLICVGCPDPDPDPEEARDCAAQQPGDTSMLAPRSVELGVMEADGSFRAYEDGELVDLIGGFQGATMITPHIQLAAQDSDADESCWWVEIEYVTDEYEDRGSRGGFVFERVDEVMRAGPFFETRIGDYEAVTLRATVVGDDFVAVDEVAVMVNY